MYTNRLKNCPKNCFRKIKILNATLIFLLLKNPHKKLNLKKECIFLRFSVSLFRADDFVSLFLKF